MDTVKHAKRDMTSASRHYGNHGFDATTR